MPRVTTFGREFGLVALVVGALNVAALGGWLEMSRGGAALASLDLLAYLMGIRHAFDIDHIAAIDNVTRRLRQDGGRPASVGLFFSLGHSTVVIAATVVLVLCGEQARELLPALRAWGTALGTGVSATFLILIGIANLIIVRQLWRARPHARTDAGTADAELGSLLERRGLMARVMRFAYRRIDRSWKMYPVGVLFGLGFDTASEILLLALTATALNSSGVGAWSLVALPLSFAAGMTLMDSVCGLGMLRLYDWSITGRNRTWAVNTGVTVLSAVLAMVVGAGELSTTLSWSAMSALGLVGGVLVVIVLLAAIRQRTAGSPSGQNRSMAPH